MIWGENKKQASPQSSSLLKKRKERKLKVAEKNVSSRDGEKNLERERHQKVRYAAERDGES